ncbi:MAG: hypothetical protein WCO20_04620 [Holophagaceae bacterium]|nr:hypothetical protein [Acidobacteriota bacterium]
MQPADIRTPAIPALIEVAAAVVGLRSVAVNWLVELESGLDLQRQSHFLATFTPALVQHFKAEEEALDLAGDRGRLRHRKEHHHLASRLMALMGEHARGRSVTAGIQGLLQAWLLHQEG